MPGLSPMFFQLRELRAPCGVSLATMTTALQADYPHVFTPLLSKSASFLRIPLLNQGKQSQNCQIHAPVRISHFFTTLLYVAFPQFDMQQFHRKTVD